MPSVSSFVIMTIKQSNPADNLPPLSELFSNPMFSISRQIKLGDSQECGELHHPTLERALISPIHHRRTPTNKNFVEQLALVANYAAPNASDSEVKNLAAALQPFLSNLNMVIHPNFNRNKRIPTEVAEPLELNHPNLSRPKVARKHGNPMRRSIKLRQATIRGTLRGLKPVIVEEEHHLRKEPTNLSIRIPDSSKKALDVFNRKSILYTTMVNLLAEVEEPSQETKEEQLSRMLESVAEKERTLQAQMDEIVNMRKEMQVKDARIKELEEMVAQNSTVSIKKQAHTRTVSKEYFCVMKDLMNTREDLRRNRRSVIVPKSPTNDAENISVN